jgi:hypothetical protein
LSLSLSLSLTFIPTHACAQGLILFLCHWIACLWWIVGSSVDNLVSAFGHSWIFRSRVDSGCPPLPEDSSNHQAAAAAALDALEQQLRLVNNSFSPEQRVVLSANWRYAWCDDRSGLPPNATSNTVGELSHDFKLYLGNVLSALPDTQLLFDSNLFVQQYFSSLYWSLTMLMKTAYIGPDTVTEKYLACILVLLGAFVFAMIMGTVNRLLSGAAPPPPGAAPPPPRSHSSRPPRGRSLQGTLSSSHTRHTGSTTATGLKPLPWPTLLLPHPHPHARSPPPRYTLAMRRSWA